MNNLYRLLQDIKNNQVMYLGKPSITCLRSFLDGYLDARTDLGLDREGCGIERPKKQLLMAVFSAQTRALLQQAGWSEDRCVNTSEYEKSLKAEGYPLHEVVLDFLKRFGGLRVVYPHHRVKDEKDEFYINPTVAVAGIGSGWVEEYSERVGVPLCVIGEAFSYHMTLVMAPDGKVYAGYDDTLIHVGDCGIDAIEAICSGRHKAQVQ